MRRLSAALGLALLLLSAAGAQTPPAAAPEAGPDDPAKISFMNYDPPSTLRVPEHLLARARYPFVDVHNHQFGLDEAKLREVVAAMDAMNMAVMVNLSGRGFVRTKGPDGRTRYFPYYRRRHAFWKLYGLDLPDEVLRKLYYGNALGLVPRLDRAAFPAAP